MNPWALDYWNSGEYHVVREKLDAETAAGHRINPERRQLFKALSLVPENKVRCVIVGQDPYPRREFATGVAFSIPKGIQRKHWPPTLETFLTEWSTDLHYNLPIDGNLEEWCQQGVLLWNAIPSCREGASLSHDWHGREWDYLTSEIITRLNRKGVVFAFCGAIARRHVGLVNEPSVVIVTSHPSPRGSQNSRTPFIESRLFTRINEEVNRLGLEPIDWRLHGSDTGEVPRTNLVGGRILPNVSNVSLPGLRQSKGSNMYVGNFDL